MNSSRSQFFLRYGLALTSVALATWTRWLLDPALGDSVAFVTYFAAIAVTAYFGGFGPTVLTIALSAGIADYLFIVPRGSLIPQRIETWASVGLFCFVGALMAISSELMSRARRSAQESSDRQRSQQERFHIALASIGEGVIVTDAAAKVTFLNSVAEQLTGCDFAAAQGLSVETVVRVLDEVTREPVENPVLQALREGKTTNPAGHSVLLARDGKERGVEQIAAPIRDAHGEISGVILVFRDVSHTRRWNIERGRLAALLASSDDAIIGLSTRGAVVSWNLGAERLYGYTAEEIIGQRLAPLIVPPDHAAENNDLMQRVARGERVDVLETVRTNKAGRRLDISKRISPILDSAGEIVGISTIDRDISQRRAAERRRNARLAVTQIVAQEQKLEVAGPRILEAVCRALQWDGGCLWTPGLSGNELHCREVWVEPSLDGESFREQSLRTALMPGVGLPGRVWQEAHCIWVADVALDDNFTRTATAAQAGLHGAFGCPIMLGGSLQGVIEFYHREILEPDEDLLEMMSTMGHQIGQFLERARAQEALRESEELLRLRVNEVIDAEERIRSVINTAMDAIITIDDRGIMQTFNPAAERLFGRSAEDVIGCHVRMLVPEGNRHEYAAYAARFLETGEVGSGREVRGLRSDGTTVPIELAAGEFHLKGKRYFTGTLHEITERKRIEATLRFLADASKLLSQLVDYRETLERVAELAVPDFADWCAVDMIAPDGTLERVAVAHIHPHQLARLKEYYGRRPHRPETTFGPPQVVRTGKSEWAAIVTDEMLESAAVDEESLAFFRDLTPRSFLCVPLTSQDQTLGSLTFVLSEPGRRYTSDDLAVAEDLARRAVIALENARLYQQIQEADRRKDEFLAMLAHELRNPLAPIRSGLDILSLQASAPKETLEIMQRQVDHLVRLVDDLLDVSRFIRGKVDLRKSPVELSAIVTQAIDVMKSLAADESQSITVVIPSEPIWLDVDRVRIVQVLENLLHNAVKYSDRGAKIELHAKRAGTEAVIRVCDNGIGIDAELLPKVFDLFTQSTRTLDRAQGGLGIGLTLVRNLVEMHDGTVTARSEGLGKGSEFEVRLPLMAAAVQPQTPLPLVQDEAGPWRVLIVDDNVGAARLLSTLVGKLGTHQVAVAHDGLTAVAQVTEFRPDIVLLDIGLPGMDGFDVARAIRGLGTGCDARLIAVTGYGQEEDRRRSLEAGFDDHVVKPVSVNTLSQILSRGMRDRIANKPVE
ncbi:MAG: PAS domain S-box protein [Planctomycetes bacterium]|nr:PAS domain S-box protein [Planctomycetota bacterium]